MDNYSPQNQLTQMNKITTKSSFISLYQEAVSQAEDIFTSANILLGTQTNTDSREQSDQDSRSSGTQTVTNTRENLDSENSCYNYFSIIL
jgi:hypothetical protein